jgi:hypothetical protein
MYKRQDKAMATPTAIAVELVPTVAVVVQSESMDRDGSVLGNALGSGLVMSQKTSQCCRCCCLQPNIDWEFKLLTEEVLTLSSQSAGMGEQYKMMDVVMHAKEDAPYVGRCFSWCSPGSRKTTYTTYLGDEGGNGEMVMTHSKETSCGQNIVYGCERGQRIPCCCFLPYMVTKDANGTVLGKSEYLCDLCLFVPKFRTLKVPFSVISMSRCCCS